MNFPARLKRLIVYRRFAELFFPSVIFSALITLLNVSGIVVTRNKVIGMILALIIVFEIYNFMNLRKCYFDLRNRKLFFGLNFLAHVIFAVINFAMYAFASNAIYSCFFSITKALTFLNINTIYSILFFHFIGLLCIVVSPIGMKWIFIKEEDESIEDR